ncbi:MAG: hypothetical protein AAFO96_03905 [Bacteroidota bacterium]
MEVLPVPLYVERVLLPDGNPRTGAEAIGDVILMVSSKPFLIPKSEIRQVELRRWLTPFVDQPDASVLDIVDFIYRFRPATHTLKRRFESTFQLNEAEQAEYEFRYSQVSSSPQSP